MDLHPKTRIVKDKSGELIFLFNPQRGSWAAITSEAYKYLEELVARGEDPLLLGLRMGFSQEEITQFLTYLLDREILVPGEQLVEEPSPTLESCYLHVTQVCNLHCRTCYSWREDRNSRRGELSLNQVDEVLAQLASVHLHTLVITGGEPLLRKDLPQILRLAKEHYHFPHIVLATNGTLVTPEKVASIASWVDEVAISLDGPTEAINAEIRGRGSFGRALRAIEAFKAVSKECRLVVTLTHRNLQYMQDFQNLGQEIGAEVTFSMFVPTGAGSSPEARDLSLTAQDLQYLGQYFVDDLPIDLDGEAKGSPSRKKDREAIEIGALQAKTGCGVGYKILAIDHDGGVYPCHMLMRPELRMGTVPNDSLVRTLQEAPLAQFFRSLDVDEIRECAGCSLRYFCGGGCRAMAYHAHGDLLAQNPACILHSTFITSSLRPVLGDLSM